MVVKSTTEAAPVGDIEAPKVTDPVRNTETTTIQEPSLLSQDEKKEEASVQKAEQETPATDENSAAAPVEAPTKEPKDADEGAAASDELVDTPSEAAATSTDDVEAPEVPPPESPIGEKDLFIEQGIPPDTPVCEGDKTDQDDGADTELGESFESTQPVIADDDNSSKNPHSRRNHFIFATVIVVLILGAVLGILFGTGVTGPKSTEADQAQAGPSTTATGAPTMSPDVDVPAPAPTDGDTSQPMPPTEAAVEDDPLLDALKVFSPSDALDDPTSPQYQAYLWMANEDELLTEAMADPAKLQQRYALATLYASLKGSIPSLYASQDECEWSTMACGTLNATNLFGAGDWQVTEINMARQTLSGSIPEEIGLLASSLVSLDMGENSISGSIPDELYQLVNLKYLYLHDNAIGGTLSEAIGNLQMLDKVFLGSNEIGGTFPYYLGSSATPRPLRFLVLYNNSFEGPIPTDMKLSNMFHMDLSFNNFNGTLPADIGETFNKLRQLYLDHNQFTGSIPETYAQAGGGRLYVLTLNDNQLTGGVPTGWDQNNLYIDTINVQNNTLTEAIDKSICQFSALQNGELVELGAECEICTCDVLCDKCY